MYDNVNYIIYSDNLILYDHIAKSYKCEIFYENTLFEKKSLNSFGTYFDVGSHHNTNQFVLNGLTICI